MAANQLTINQVTFVGNDINDVEYFDAVGFGVVVAEANPRSSH